MVPLLSLASVVYPLVSKVVGGGADVPVLAGGGCSVPVCEPVAAGSPSCGLKFEDAAVGSVVSSSSSSGMDAGGCGVLGFQARFSGFGLERTAPVSCLGFPPMQLDWAGAVTSACAKVDECRMASVRFAGGKPMGLPLCETSCEASRPAKTGVLAHLGVQNHSH